MNSEIAVSVIMPSLNVVKYIDECMQSVLNQTLKNIEIICVDAGSTDGTLEKLKNYATIDSRIKIVVSDKKSYGYQVNLGFSIAHGEYLAIVETDDYIDKEMYESLYLIARANDLDYIKADFARFKCVGGKKVFHHSNIVESERYYNRVLWAGDEWSVFNGSIYPWAGIYKRNLITNNNIKLNETAGASYQDNGLCFQVYAYGKRGYFVKEEFYYLRREEQDASYYAPHKFKEIIEEFEFIYDFLIKSDYYSVFAPRFCKLKYQTFCWRANMLADEHKLEFMRLFAESFRNAQANGTLDLRCFNSNEKKDLFNIMSCPELACWKKYYTPQSVWQKEFANRKKHKLTSKTESIVGKKILVITNELAQSGAQLSTLAQCDIIQKTGAYVEVWSLRDGVLCEKYKEQGITVKIIYPNEFERSWVQDEIRKFDLAIVCTVLSIPALSICETLIPTILYIRSDGKLLSHFFKNVLVFGEEYKRFYSILNARYLIAVSEYCGEWVRNNLNPNVHVINNFLEDKFKIYSKREIRKDSKVKFLALGTIEFRKGFDIYLEAFLSLPKAIRDCCELHFAGRKLNGEEKFFNKIVELANQNNNNCFYHGEIINRDEIYKLINECDVIVVPSRSESSSRVALEGAMLGKPLIVTEDVGAKYLVDKNSGWIVKTEDIDSLATAFKEALANRTNLEKMGKAARNKYLHTSTIEIYSKDFISYIERVLADYKEKRREINNNCLWSFDVFDTLITRNTATPRGIFSKIQQKLMCDKQWSDIPFYTRSNYYELRINSEILARAMRNGTDFERFAGKNICNEDITLQDIYNVFIFSNLLNEEQANRIQELEIETEIESVVGIPRNINMVKQLLKEGERVIAISDMYHSRKTIQKMLETADPFLSNVKVYVSSDFSLTKGTGSLYRKVKEYEIVNFIEWHHTGDHKRGDYEVAKEYGINAELYTTSWKTKLEDYILNEFANDDYVQGLVAFAKNTRIIYNLSNIQSIGADLGTFILIPYVEFIINQSINRNIKRLYFIARDGYILKKIADILIENNKIDIETKYIMASRKAWRVFPEFSKDVDLIKLISSSNYNFIKTKDELAEVLMITRSELDKFLTTKSFSEEMKPEELYVLVEELNKNDNFKQFLIEKNKKKRELMANYIHQEVDTSDENYAFVELNGSGYTTHIMSKVMYNKQNSCKPIKTFYYWAQNIKLMGNEQEFISFFPSKIARGSIIECLCRAPHSQVIGYTTQGKKVVPVYEYTNEKDELSSKGYDDYIYGVMCAAKTYIFGTDINVLKVVEKAFDYITNKPDDDILSFLGDIPFSVTGRSEKISTFAPVLSRDDIFNVYFLRHLNQEPIEKYFSAAYFDYCLFRLTNKDRELIQCYENKVNELRRTNKLQSISIDERNRIRYELEMKCYGNSEINCKLGDGKVEKKNNINNNPIHNVDNNRNRDISEKIENSNIVNIETYEFERLQYDSYCLKEVRNSFSYKIGMAITKPVRMLRKK